MCVKRDIPTKRKAEKVLEQVKVLNMSRGKEKKNKNLRAKNILRKRKN